METIEKNFTIYLNGEAFRANRDCLQKHSDFFATLFASGAWKENTNNRVELHDVEPQILQQVSSEMTQ